MDRKTNRQKDSQQRDGQINKYTGRGDKERQREERGARKRAEESTGDG